MSSGPDPQATLELIEKTNQEINLLVEEIARLSERDIPPAEYFGEFLKRVLTVLVAPAGAIWLRTPQGHLQLQYQINLAQVALDRDPIGRQSHDELLRQGLQQARPGHFPPHSSAGTAEPGTAVAGNPTDYAILMAPILGDKQVSGLVEIWQSPNRHPRAVRGFVQFLVKVASLASRYLRNHQLRQMIGQQQIWMQMEAFARTIHGSLNPTEVAYLVANEGRRLVECDRISIAVRHSKRCSIEAISGADVVEKRSNLVQLMRALCNHVLTWNEKLVYSGAKDDTLPPDVLKALDEFLAESHSKLVVILPLRDERESESKKPARSALMMESFEPAVAAEQLVAQLEVVGRHATTALYNAVEHRRIPLRFLWQPLAKLQEGLGGKTRAIVAGIGAALLLLLLVMLFVPYPLKMDAKGQLLPQERRYIFSPVAGQVIDFEEGVEPGGLVFKDQSLLLLHDADLESNLIKLKSDIQGAKDQIEILHKRLNDRSEASNTTLMAELKSQEVARDEKTRELEAMQERTNSDKARPGYFWLKSPFNGTVLNADFREKLIHRYVKPSEPLLRIGDKDRRWEVELKIPEKHIGQVLEAFPSRDAHAELDVDLLLTSEPTHVFKGKLSRDKIAGQADPNRDDNNETAPVVLAWVRIDGQDIPEANRIPTDRLVTGVEVHSRIRCGQRPMGYSLFYGVWEFLYEKGFLYF